MLPERMLGNLEQVRNYFKKKSDGVVDDGDTVISACVMQEPLTMEEICYSIWSEALEVRSKGPKAHGSKSSEPIRSKISKRTEARRYVRISAP